jgi:hypothetical protein
MYVFVQKVADELVGGITSKLAQGAMKVTEAIRYILGLTSTPHPSPPNL